MLGHDARVSQNHSLLILFYAWDVIPYTYLLHARHAHVPSILNCMLGRAFCQPKGPLVDNPEECVGSSIPPLSHLEDIPALFLSSVEHKRNQKGCARVTFAYMPYGTVFLHHEF